MKNKFLSSNRLLFTFIILENLFLYYFHNKCGLGQDKNAFGLFLSSVFFGIVLLYKFYNTNIKLNNHTGWKTNGKFVLLFCFLSSMLLLIRECSTIISSFPINASFSDVVPMVMHMSGNFVKGLNPYIPVFLNGSNELPSYLPMQWLPFTVAELLKADYRFVPVIAWCIVSLWLFIRAMKIDNPMVRIFIPLLIIASLYFMLQYNGGIVGVTVELLIAAYYMLFIIGLNQSNGVVQGILISLCLLSRYSLVLWLPLYAFVLYTSNNRKQLYSAVVTSALIVLLLYVIPFLSKDWSLFGKAYKAYDNAALGEWAQNMNAEEKPAHLYSGTGFAYSIYSSFPFLTIPERIVLMQRIHLGVSLLVTAILGIWYWRKKDRIDTRIFLLGSFKIYLAVFLFLIQVPYTYLMIVGNFISVAIFCEQARYTIFPKKLQAS